MTAAGVIFRWIQLVPGLALVGIFTALLLAGRSERPTARAWESRLLRWARGLVLLVPLAGLAALGYQAAHVTGRPAAGLEPENWRRVLLETQFGAVWLLRHGLLLLLGALVLLRERERSPADWAAFRGEVWLLAGVAAGALAWAGHAAAVEPGGLAAALADALHLVAAGVWLGALLPLALLLRAASREAGADSRPFAVLAVRRFSRLALLTMLVLVATGLWNAWNQVGAVPALIGTRYGGMLIVKVLLLAPILGLAWINRTRLLPALSGDGPTVGRPAMARLGRRVTAEWALGMVILVLASALSTTPPARHEAPWWPLSFRLDYAATAALPGVKARLLVGSQLTLVGLLAGVVALIVSKRRALFVGAGAGALAVGLAVALPPLAVDAYPTTYRRPAVPYNALSVTNGRTLYEKHCAGCHGVSGRGDGPGGAGLPKPPADLTAPHTGQHTAGDLLWWLTHGIAASGMPAFGERLSAEERWDAINFVRALSAGEQARGLGPVLEPGRPRLAAPDFSYAVGPGPGRALKDFRGRQAVLLVLFTLPGSRERLVQLAQSYDTVRGLGAEVLAVPLDGGDRIITRLGGTPPILFPVATEGSPEVARAYGLFARTGAPGGARSGFVAPAHLELLIDRQGYIRARWIPGGGAPGWSQAGAIVALLQQLAREAPAPPPDEHVH